MSFLNIFKKNKRDENNFASILKNINNLTEKYRLHKVDESSFRIQMNKYYKMISKILFDAVLNDDFLEIKNILSNKNISKVELLDDNGYNIIDYSLFNTKNELFKKLYSDCYDDISIYFSKPSILFTIILNKKNFDLIEFFLKNESLSNGLKTENLTNCLFVLLQENQILLLNYLINNFADFFDSRNIEASLIYSISHNQIDKIKLLLSYPILVSKFSSSNVEKMIMLSILNQNIEVLEIMVENQYFLKIIEKMDLNIIKNILQMAKNKRNSKILNIFLNNDTLKGNFNDFLKIENK